MALSAVTGSELRAPSTFEANGVRYRVEARYGNEMTPLVRLFRDAFHGRAVDTGWFERKYGCENRSVRGFACVAFGPNGEAAGSVGLLPWLVRYGERLELAGQLVDVATGSEHRGRGLFVRLAEVVRDVCGARGVSFLFGFPNEAAYPIWIAKLGYSHVDDLVEYRFAVRTLPAEKAFSRIGVLQRLHENYAQHLLDRLDAGNAMKNSLTSEGFGCVERNAAFYAYKSAFAGSRVLSVDGGLVWLRLGGQLFLGDIEARDEPDLERTLQAVRRLATRLGTTPVVFQTSRGTRLDAYLSGRWNRLPGLPIIHRNIDSQIPVEKLKFTFGDLDNF
jgi:hypothetical protein